MPVVGPVLVGVGGAVVVRVLVQVVLDGGPVLLPALLVVVVTGVVVVRVGGAVGVGVLVVGRLLIGHDVLR
ncbi:hypothetical protein GCM10011519_22570 [Marmoricola endophyticus]|uniref:Uncharacterized protein n=1 Tax=Marmoricola endophyticus TaxID=2040280 RepID=A0A917F339_9ACTN|nr:hypothetical protein GCM10011519_22570 [Marmoricola endophyticus]